MIVIDLFVFKGQQSTNYKRSFCLVVPAICTDCILCVFTAQRVIQTLHILFYGFQGRRIEWSYSGYIKSKLATGRHLG